MGLRSLYYGDNLEILRNRIKDGTVDLCYIDPPFNSKRNYNQIYNNIGKEDQAQMQAFIDTWTWDSFAENGFNEILTNEHGRFTMRTMELIKGLHIVLDRGSLLAYIISMTLRIVEIYRVLKPTGSFYLHCDPTASHYLKIVLDSIFCSQSGKFGNEIIWHYEKWTAISNAFQKNHDIVYFYKKTSKATFNVQKKITENLKIKYEKGYLIGGGYGGNGLVVYDKNNAKVKKLIDSGKYQVHYADMDGKPLSDVWTIPFINPVAKERLNYPTQKPEALLERIIKASSNKGDVVLDAYCGCGTTIAVAERLNRNWIGIDITYQSISVIMQRLEDSFGKDIINKITLDGIPKDIESAKALSLKKDDRTRKEFEKWAILTYTNNHATINERKSADKGVDGKVYFMIDHNEYALIVFQVKSGKVQRDDIAKLKGDMERENAVMGILITLENPTKPMNLEAKSAGIYRYGGCEFDKIQIVTIKDIIENKKRLNLLPVASKTLKSASRKKVNETSIEDFL